MCQLMKKIKDMIIILVIDTVDKDTLVIPIEERLAAEAQTVVIMNFDIIVAISMMRW